MTTNTKQTDNKQKHAGGRPTKYKPEYSQILIDFFDVEPTREIELPHYASDGKISWIDKKIVANKIPSLVKFAKHINTSISTVYDWINPKHTSYQKRFSDAFTRVAKEMRKDMLIDMGMSGVSPPNAFKFVAVNMTDMRDKQELEHGVNADLKQLLQEVAEVGR